MRAAETLVPRAEHVAPPATLREVGVVLGAQGFQEQHYERRGIGRYAQSYVNTLCDDHPERVVRIDIDPSIPPPRGLAAAGLTRMSGAEFATAPVDTRRLVYHVLAPFQPWPLHRLWPRWARNPNIALAVTLYDLIPLRHRERYLNGFGQTGYFPRLSLLQVADAVLAISATAAADAVELLHVDERRVHVVGTASPGSLMTHRGGGPPERPPERLRAGNVLFITAEDWRKNTERTIDAYAGLRSELRAAHPLTIVGGISPQRQAELTERAIGHGIAEDVIITGEIPDEHLDALRRASSIAFCPSLDEGFGLPVLEGLENGIATFASDIPSHRALVRDPDARFDPTSVDAMRCALERGLMDEALRDRLRAAAPTWAAPHTWQQVVRRSVDAYDAAVRERHRRAPGGRRGPFAGRSRLPIVSSGPLGSVDMATGETRLVEALARHVDVDLYDDVAVRVRTVSPGVRVVPARSFGWHREMTGAALPPLFCLDNDGASARTWQLFMRCHGDVLLHDVRLVELYRALDRRGWLGRGVVGESGLQVRLRLLEGVTASEVDALGTLMLGEVVDRARRVYVHTMAARELVLGKRPQRADDVVVVPFALPDASPPSSTREAAVIAAFDYGDTADLLLDAATPILRDDPTIRLVCAGPEATAGDAERLRAIARSRGVAAQVELPGPLDREQYRTLLARATVAVQLRTDSDAYLSGALANCLAAGLPTIVSDAGATRELPSDTVLCLGSRPGSEAVTAALKTLFAVTERRSALGDAALRCVRSHSAEHAASALLAAIRAG